MTDFLLFLITLGLLCAGFCVMSEIVLLIVCAISRTPLKKAHKLFWL